MAGFIPTVGAVRTDIQFQCGNQQIHNVLWFSREANWTQAEREALNDAIEAWWSTSAKQYFATDMALTQIKTVNQESASAPASTLIVTPAVAGTVSGGALPNNAAVVATLRTDQRGRNYRGRMYLGGLAKTATDSPLGIPGSVVANLLTALAALKTAIEALGAIWVVVSHFLAKAPRAQGLKTPITGISMDNYIDSQRRRLAGRGV